MTSQHIIALTVFIFLGGFALAGIQDVIPVIKDAIAKQLQLFIDE